MLLINDLFEESNLLDTNLKFFKLTDFKLNRKILRDSNPGSNFMWATLWPPSLYLAKYLLNNQDILKNKNVLDYGAGNGIIGCLAKSLGAVNVDLYDRDSYAQQACAFMANLNDVKVNILNECPLKILKKYDLILMGDMLFSREVKQKIKIYIKNIDTRIIFSDFNRSGEDLEFLNIIHTYENELKDESGLFFNTCSIYELVQRR